MEWCGVQQGDGGGKEAGPEPTGSGPNASVSPPGWEEVKQCVAGVGGVLDDAARSVQGVMCLAGNCACTVVWKAWPAN